MKTVHFSTGVEFCLEATVTIVSTISVGEEMFKLGTWKSLCPGRLAIYAMGGLDVTMVDAFTFRFN